MGTPEQHRIDVEGIKRADAKARRAQASQAAKTTNTPPTDGIYAGLTEKERAKLSKDVEQLNKQSQQNQSISKPPPGAYEAPGGSPAL